MSYGVRVKICGVTRAEDADAAIEAGADALGLNFVPSSPRFVDDETAGRIARRVRDRAELWGVFVDEDPRRIRQLARELPLSRVQLHGDEPPAQVSELADLSVVKGIRVRGAGDLAALNEYRPWAFLLDACAEDARGGTGRTFDWGVARGAATDAMLVLAGGLTPENVRRAVRAVRPDWVDTASGVETSPGVKDPELMRRFVQEARGGSAHEE